MDFENLDKQELVTILKRIDTCMKTRIADEVARINEQTATNYMHPFSVGYVSSAGFVLDLIHASPTGTHSKQALGEL